MKITPDNPDPWHRARTGIANGGAASLMNMLIAKGHAGLHLLAPDREKELLGTVHASMGRAWPGHAIAWQHAGEYLYRSLDGHREWPGHHSAAPTVEVAAALIALTDSLTNALMVTWELEADGCIG